MNKARYGKIRNCPVRQTVHAMACCTAQAQTLSQCQGEDDNPASYDDEELTYEDRHWRLICLQPIGTSWLARAEVIAQKVAMQQVSHGKNGSMMHFPKTNLSALKAIHVMLGLVRLSLMCVLHAGLVVAE